MLHFWYYCIGLEPIILLLILIATVTTLHMDTLGCQHHALWGVLLSAFLLYYES